MRSSYFQAPEAVNISEIGTASDIFSLGVLICYLYSPEDFQWKTTKSDTFSYQKFLESKCHGLPNTLKDSVKLMLHDNINIRPDAYQFLKVNQ